MSGNVSEWTSTAYDAASYYYVSDISPDYQYNADDSEDETLKRKVIRGGSWKDVAYFMQNGVRDYEYQDTAKCYIGFRCVQSFLGRDAKDF
jgi:formylglycine-generating enzyme required for sulfatase activity